MRHPIIAAYIIFVLFLAGCNQGYPPIPSDVPTQTTPTGVTPTKTRSHAIFTPTQSITPIPTLTFTPQPTQTPTAKITSTPAVISPINAGGLKREAIYSLPIRGSLQTAEWSQDGESVLVMTDIGPYLLDGSSLSKWNYSRA